MKLLRSAVLPLALMLVSGTAEAQITRFYAEDNTGSEGTRATNVNSLAKRNQFLSNLTGVGTETFESQSGSAPLALTFPGAGTATLTGTGSVAFQGTGTNGYGRYPISGSRYWEATLSKTGTFGVTFSQHVAAFGFYAMDLGDFGSNLTLQFLSNGTVVDTWTPYTSPYSFCGNPYCGSIKFIGAINTNTFNEVKFIGSSSDDVFAFDDMTVGSLEQVSTVPEPSTYALMGAGLAALGFVARRRRNTVA